MDETNNRPLEEGMEQADGESITGEIQTERIAKDIKEIGANKFLLILLGVIILLIAMAGFMAYQLGWDHSNKECNNKYGDDPFIVFDSTIPEPKIKYINNTIIEKEYVYINSTKECPTNTKLIPANNTIGLIRDLKACEYRLANSNTTGYLCNSDYYNRTMIECESSLRTIQEVIQDVSWRFNNS